MKVHFSTRGMPFDSPIECDLVEEGETGLYLKEHGEAAGTHEQIGYIPYNILKGVAPD